jgi:hypothetical protein
MCAHGTIVAIWIRKPWKEKERSERADPSHAAAFGDFCAEAVSATEPAGEMGACGSREIKSGSAR